MLTAATSGADRIVRLRENFFSCTITMSDRTTGLVDVSPLSTLGALCVAAVPDGPAARTLFRQLLIWGVCMTLVGALLCQLLADALARSI